MTNTLPLTPVVDVTYTLNPVAAAKASFGIGAILGPSRVFNKTTRGQIFLSVDEMLEYGFQSTDPEVAAAQVYFAASSKPKKLYVGAYVNYNVSPTAGTNTSEVYSGAWSNGNKIILDDTDYIIGDGTSSTTTMAAIKTAAEALGATFTYVTGAKTTVTYNAAFGNGNIVSINGLPFTMGDGTGETTTIADILTALLTAGCQTATYDSSASTLNFVCANEAFGDDDPDVTFTVTQGTGSEVGTLSTVRGNAQTMNYNFGNTEVGALPLEVVFGIEQNTGSAVGTPVTTMGTDPVEEVTEETPLEAFQANRAYNTEWYAGAFTMELTKTQLTSVAAYVESAANVSTFFFNCSASDVLTKTAGNTFETMEAAGYKRTIAFHTAKAYTHIGAMGYAMGQTKDTANSSYTLALKNLPGCTVDGYTSAQVSNIESYNGNVYINRGASYDMTEKGTCFSGDYYDEIIQLDKLANSIQVEVMNLLYGSPKVAQTENGLARIKAKISTACEEAVKTGFIAPGTWTGADILELESGDTLPLGYVVLSETFEDQSQADREARKAPNIYVPIKLAGAIQSVVIEIPVNR